MPASVTSWRCAAIRRPAWGDLQFPHPGGYANAAELVGGLKRIGDFQVSVAGYPEASRIADVAADLDNLKRKIDAGADRCITQFFFGSTISCASAIVRQRRASHVPIVPGIMPSPTSGRLADRRPLRQDGPRCRWFANLFDGLDGDVETRRMIAATVAGDLCRRLRDGASTSSISTR